ncbi:MAG: FtsX-like permease family protein [Patescibacteria group bacterium]
MKNDLRIGFFLALREIKKANKWTTALIITVMVLTFLNLIVISGVLVGLIEGSTDANRYRYTGDLILSTLPKKNFIERSTYIQSLLENHPYVERISPRYAEPGRVQANYKNRTRLSDAIDSAGGMVFGIDPAIEDSVTHLSKYLVEGEYLDDSDADQILIGANLLYKYTPVESPGFSTLKNVEVGSRVRLVIGDTSREVTVKGIIKSKVDPDQGIFMIDRELKKIIGRNDNNVDSMAVILKKNADPKVVKDDLVNQGVDQYALVQTWEEAQPKFLNDIKATFGLLGNMIGSIGLAVASITIFIIIFVNAITRRRFIGILKGIGIRSRAIEVSYVIQSLFYAFFGIAIGSLIVFLVLQPYIAAHPINFPFSDGILVATFSGTLIRGIILLFATLIAGYIPARLVVKQNTLDAILGR